MTDERIAPDSTAVRTALWRALHLEVDAQPPVLEDRIGLELAAPDENWRNRPEMNPAWTSRIRAAIVARARFVEDLVIEQAARGVMQYVILGAGLDTFVQRRPDVASRLQVFEVERPGPQEWKRRRLNELKYGVPPYLHLVPVDFESGESWWDRLVSAGFDASRPAIAASTGVSMYLTKEATMATLRQMARLAQGSTFAMTFMPTSDFIEPEDRMAFEMAKKGAASSGTPFISFYAPSEMMALAREAGFKDARHVWAADYRVRYFANRADKLQPGSGEDFLIATT